MTKTVKRVCGVALVVMAATFVTAAEYAGVDQVEAAAQTKRTSSLKGVIKSIDDSAVVVVPNENKRVEVTFKVTSETTRSGAVAAGDEITVSYHFEQTQRVATALAGK
jgi:hypothetical protein